MISESRARELLGITEPAPRPLPFTNGAETEATKPPLHAVAVYFSPDLGKRRLEFSMSAVRLGATVLDHPIPNCYIVYGDNPDTLDTWLLSTCVPAREWEEVVGLRINAACKGITMSEMGLGERPFNINDWIDKQLGEKGFSYYTASHSWAAAVLVRDAAEIARGAVLHVIADRDALIANLRGAGYTVTPPPVDHMHANARIDALAKKHKDAFLARARMEAANPPARLDANGNVIPWAEQHDAFMAFDPANPDIPLD